MPNTPLAKIPYPSGSDAPAAAADMMAAFMNMDARLVLPAVDEADRDARYSEAPESSLVVSGASKKIWLKTGPTAVDWVLIFGDTGWVTNGFVVSDGWSISNVAARNRNGNINIRGEVLRTGDDIEATAGGNVPDVKMLDVPPQFRPPSNALAIIGLARSDFTSGTCQLYSDGRLMLLDIHSNSWVRNGQYVRFSLSLLED